MTGIPASDGVLRPRPDAPPPFRVREAVAGDLDAIVAVEEASFSTPWSRGTFQDLLGRERVLFRVLVQEEGRVVGHGILWRTGDEGELANLAVDPELRRRGAGGLLLDTLLHEARSRGVDRVYLEVRVSNEAAAELYRARGFREVGIRPRYYSNPREDARVLAVRLQPPGSQPDPPMP